MNLSPLNLTCDSYCMQHINDPLPVKGYIMMCIVILLIFIITAILWYINPPKMENP